MKPGLVCSDYSFPLLPFEPVLDLISAMEFDGVDIGLFAGSSHIDPDHVLNDISTSARQLSALVEARGLVLADIFLTPAQDFETLAPNHPDDRERRKSREVFLRALDFTVQSGALHMSALPGADFAGCAFDENLARSADELAWRVEKAEKAGMIFAIEPHIGSIVPTPDKIISLLERTPGLTLSLDWSHLACEGIPDSEIEPLIANASHFHARCARAGSLQAPMKENAIDFKRILEKMAKTRYAGAIAVEYVWIEWKNCNEVDNVSETILLRNLLYEIREKITWEI